VEWAGNIVSRAKTLFGIDHLEISIPFLQGGKTYVHASENFKDGLRFEAYDGKSWESGIPILLGPAFNPFMVNWEHPETNEWFTMLPSGIALTTLLGTLTTLSLLRFVKDGRFVILGDDLNGWSIKGMFRAWFMEPQVEDTRNQFILGVSYKIDPHMPVTCGTKITMDKGSETIGVPLVNGDVLVSASEGGEQVKSPVIYKERPFAQRALYFGTLFGYFGKDTLINRLENVKPGEYVSPGELFDRHLEEYSKVDATAWAEEIGAREVLAVA
jgi:hypothetical protein